MTHSLTRLLPIALILLASASSTLARDPLKVRITVFRVFPIFESEGSRRVARSELGCDPCQEVIHEDLDGNDARYFLDPGAGVHLDGNVVDAVGVDSGEKGTVVVVTLTEQGKSLIESLATGKTDSAANFANGEVIDIVPLWMFGARYVVAFAPTPLAAEQILQRLRGESR